MTKKPYEVLSIKFNGEIFSVGDVVIHKDGSYNAVIERFCFPESVNKVWFYFEPEEDWVKDLNNFTQQDRYHKTHNPNPYVLVNYPLLEGVVDGLIPVKPQDQINNLKKMIETFATQNMPTAEELKRQGYPGKPSDNQPQS